MRRTKEIRTRFGMYVVFVVLLSAVTISGEACLEDCDCVGDQHVVADCSGKKLNKVPTNINTTLHYIDLSNNSITEIRMSDFSGYANISVLNLSSNGVSVIYEDSFKELINVTHIYLSGNNISYLPPSTFNHNANLKKLYLKSNPLTLPNNKSILKSDSVTYLDIAYCNITVLPAEIFAALPNLVAMRLDGNVLTNITTETFEPLRSLEEIYMESETVKCAETSYQEFLNYLEKRAIKYYGPAICFEECSTTTPLALKLTVPIANPATCNQTHLVLTSTTTGTISGTEATTPPLIQTTVTSNDARHTANMSSSVTHNPDLRNFTEITESHEELTSKSLSGNHSPSLMMTTINILSACFGLLRVL
jgi:hypothetical protein